MGSRHSAERRFVDGHEVDATMPRPADLVRGESYACCAEIATKPDDLDRDGRGYGARYKCTKKVYARWALYLNESKEGALATLKMYWIAGRLAIQQLRIPIKCAVALECGDINECCG